MSEPEFSPDTNPPENPAQSNTPESTDANKPENKKGSFASELYGWLQALTVALVCLIVVFTFFGRIIGVDGQSMVPTLADKDMLLLQCIAYEPEQGDVVVLHKNFADVEAPIVKRIIAVGGQTVRVDYTTGAVYVDDERLEEPYLGEQMVDPDNAYMQHTEWEVPLGSVFVMGDNRNHSSDSRDERLGVVDTRYILGRAVFIMLPPQHMGVIH